MTAEMAFKLYRGAQTIKSGSRYNFAPIVAKSLDLTGKLILLWGLDTIFESALLHQKSLELTKYLNALSIPQNHSHVE